MSRVVRVLAAIELFAPHFSGAGYRFKRYAPRLRAHGVQLEVLCGARPSTLIAEDVVASWRKARIGAVVEVGQVDEVPITRVRLPFPEERPGWFSSPLAHLRPAEVLNYSAVRRCVGPARPDVLQITSVDRRQTPLILAGRALIPTLVAWTMISQRDAEGIPRWARPAWRAQFDASTEVVVNGTAMGALLHDVGVRRPVNVLSNGVDLEEHHPVEPAQKRRLRQELGLGKGPLVVTLGRMNPRKRQHLLLEAFREVVSEQPTAQLVVLGPTEDTAYGRSLRRLAEGCANRVRWVGQQADVRPYLRAADIFAFASAQEGLPNAVLEAMASGLPVVTTRFRGFGDELGVPGRDLIALEDDTPQALANALIDLIKRPQRAAEIGANGRLFVEQHHDLEDAVAAYAALYRRLAGC